MKKTKLADDLLAYWNATPTSLQLPIWRQIIEMALLYFLRRIGPGYYLQARWGRKEISFKHKWQHVNRFEYLRLISRLNPIAYRKASQHKLIEKSILCLQGFPTPKFIGYFHFLRGRSGQGTPLRNAVELTTLLTNHVNQRVCFKPVEGYGGFGFASYEIRMTNESVQLCRKPDEVPISIDEWCEMNGHDKDGFILESHLQQHADMAALNSSSLNTIRMWVVWDDNCWKVLGGYLRIGRAGNQVDNTSSGGLACPIDVASGMICDAFNPTHPGETLKAHPDSKIVLMGFQIPFWQEAKILANEALAAFPHMELTGLDMAITATGPSLIELNLLPDYVGCAWMGLPLKGLLHDQN